MRCSAPKLVRSDCPDPIPANVRDRGKRQEISELLAHVDFVQFFVRLLLGYHAHC